MSSIHESNEAVAMARSTPSFLQQVEDSKAHAKTKEEFAMMLKTRMREAINFIHENHKEMVRMAISSLEVFIKEERPVTTKRSPRDQFVCEQYCLVAIDFLNRITKKRLNFIDVREDIGNLACLYDYYEARDGHTAANVSRLFQRLVALLADIAAKIESLTLVEETDWPAVLANYVEPKVSHDRDCTLISSIPKISEISQIRLLGAGGFGAVYKISIGGIYLSGKLVPVSKFKSPKHACADKLVASVVCNPFVVKYYATFITPLAFVSIMEYIRGVDLSRIISKEKIIATKATKYILAQLGLAVLYLHHKGFIHRDIKPSNTIILPGCRLKLIDYDTCKTCVGRFTAGTNNTYIRRTYVEFRDHESAGTLYFIPPEVFKRKAYGRAVDWWAIGVTSYQLCTGKLPLRANKERVLREKIRKAEINFEVGDPEHQALNIKLLAKNSIERITSASFEEFQEHPWLAEVKWDSLGTDANHVDLKVFAWLMHTRGGRLTPRTANRGTRKCLRFNELRDTRGQEPLYMHLSSAFQKSMSKVHDGLQISEEDIQDPVELVDVNSRFSSYKFEQYLSKAPDKQTETYVATDLSPRRYGKYSSADSPPKKLKETSTDENILLTSTPGMRKKDIHSTENSATQLLKMDASLQQATKSEDDHQPKSER